MKYRIRQLLWLTTCVGCFCGGWVFRDKSTQRQKPSPVRRGDVFCRSPLSSFEEGFYSYDPESFWDDLAFLQSEGRFQDAVWLMGMSSPEELIRRRGRSYCALGYSLGGVLFDAKAEYNAERDFFMPEQSFSVPYSNVYAGFQRAYSERYNRLVDEIFPQPPD